MGYGFTSVGRSPLISSHRDFEVNKALVSQSRLFQLRSLDEASLAQVLDRALQDRERGYGDRPIQVQLEARTHLLRL